MNVRTVIVACALAGFAHAAFAADDETLQKVKDLYAAAAYEEALGVLTEVPDGQRTPELDQYRAFCFIALGQKEQAQAAIEAVLAKNPLYLPDPEEMSPRVIEAFTDVRLRVLPVLTKQMYLEAKAALERKDRQRAIDGFQQLLGVIDGVQPPDGSFDDLKVLAAGFLDLSKALPEPPKPAATPAGNVAPSTGAVTEAAPEWSSRPVVVRQDLPAWEAADPISRRSEFSGTLRVRVGADGRVESAQMLKPIHPAYDPLLIRASRNWLYQPARQNGVPVPADVVVEVRLRPQE